MDSRNQLKEKISRLSIEEQEKLKEYTDALVEIKNEIRQLLNKKKVAEGGDVTGKILQIKEE